MACMFPRFTIVTSWYLWRVWTVQDCGSYFILHSSRCEWCEGLWLLLPISFFLQCYIFSYSNSNHENQLLLLLIFSMVWTASNEQSWYLKTTNPHAIRNICDYVILSKQGLAFHVLEVNDNANVNLLLITKYSLDIPRMSFSEYTAHNFG